MFKLCYYATIMFPLNVYYAAINLSWYYAVIMLPLKVYYVTIMLLLIVKVYYATIIIRHLMAT